jgi:hypothetical protein
MQHSEWLHIVAILGKKQLLFPVECESESFGLFELEREFVDSAIKFIVDVTLVVVTYGYGTVDNTSCPILLLVTSVNQRLPSGPAAITWSPMLAVRPVLNSLIVGVDVGVGVGVGPAAAKVAVTSLGMFIVMVHVVAVVESHPDQLSKL